jgi:hypothetical protein
MKIGPGTACRDFFFGRWQDAEFSAKQLILND